MSKRRDRMANNTTRVNFTGASVRNGMIFNGTKTTIDGELLQEFIRPAGHRETPDDGPRQSTNILQYGGGTLHAKNGLKQRDIVTAQPECKPAENQNPTSNDSEAFKVVLDFLANDSIEPKFMQTQADEILKIAEKYKLENLKEYLSKQYYEKSIAPQTAVNYLFLAHEFKMDKLKLDIFAFIRDSTEMQILVKEVITKAENQPDLVREWLTFNAASK